MTDKESYVNVADLKRKLRAFAKYRQYSKPATDELLGVVSKLKISIKADLETTLESADVQPIKKGHWYHNTSKYISELDAYFIQARCSCCGKYSDRVDLYSTIMSNEMCSHCGARMDGDTQ